MLQDCMVNELTTLKNCAHSNIMTVRHLLHDDENFYIVSELCEGGELFDRVIEVQKFTET